MSFEPPHEPKDHEAPTDITFSEREGPTFGGPSKTITIRGVDTEVYDQFSKKLQEAEMKIGDAISKMMQDVNKDFDEHIPELSSKSIAELVPLKSVSINHHDELEIEEKDLVESNVRVSFNHIGTLSFDPSVTTESFLKYVRSINHCDTVEIPKILPKLIILSKLNNVDNLEFLEGE